MDFSVLHCNMAFVVALKITHSNLNLGNKVSENGKEFIYDIFYNFFQLSWEQCGFSPPVTTTDSEIGGPT